MKILIVCSGNSGGIVPFVYEQAESLVDAGIEIDYFLVKGKGVFGYLNNLKPLKENIAKGKYDLVHAHYGLSGLLACLQHIKPVVITFHGGDIDKSENLILNRLLSFVASVLSKKNIFVNKKISKLFLLKEKSPVVISCGVDLDTFCQIEKDIARAIMGLSLEKKYALFSSAFDNPVKSYPLAKKALSLIDYQIELIELKGYSREEVSFLMNAVDLLLITSFSETGPMVAKEAMACGCPIVSTNVGDIRDVIGNIDGCRITSFDPHDIADQINCVVRLGKRVDGRSKIVKLGLDLDNVSKRVISVYKDIYHQEGVG